MRVQMHQNVSGNVSKCAGMCPEMCNASEKSTEMRNLQLIYFKHSDLHLQAPLLFTDNPPNTYGMFNMCVGSVAPDAGSPSVWLSFGWISCTFQCALHNLAA